jgi:hypothetical protein
MTNRRTLKNTSTPTQKMIGEINLQPDFDSSFSSQLPQSQNTYGEINRNGEEFYTPSVGSFFIDCSQVLVNGKAPTYNTPIKVQVPLIVGGFGRFATSSFTPAEFGVSGSVPNQQTYKDVFDFNTNNTRFQRNSIELTYTIINNARKPQQHQFERTTAKHKTLISTWNAYGMNTMTTDADGNVVLPNEPNVMTHSYIPRGYDYTYGNLGDPDYDYGGVSNQFYQTQDPYYGANDYSGYGNPQTPTILDSDLYNFSSNNAAIGDDDALIYNINNIGDNTFHIPRVIASSRIEPGPNYVQLTPVFEFFLVNKQIFVKGIYRIY